MIGLLPISLLYILLAAIDSILHWGGLKKLLLSLLGVIITLWGFVFGMFYILARLYLLVETFRTLVFLPPDAFISTWVSNIPNVS
jgi:hypothetical protein